MELHIIDRISIPSILPSENSFMDYNLKRSIIKKVGITKGDVEKYNIKEDAENKRENPLVVDFTAQELEYLKNACEKLSDTPAPDYLWDTVEKIYDAAQAKA